MDDIRKNLIQGMGAYARQSKLEKLKKKYSTGMPAMDADLEKQDAAADAAHMPEPKNDPDASLESKEQKLPSSALSIINGMKDLNQSAAKGNQDYKDALSGFGDDEELRKYLAQK